MSDFGYAMIAVVLSLSVVCGLALSIFQSIMFYDHRSLF